MVDACAKHGDIKETEEIFERTRSAGVFPDVVTFNNLIDGCAEHGDVEKPRRFSRR